MDANLRQAFPDEPRAWRNRVARASYRHLVRESIATFRMANVRREALLASLDAEADDLAALHRDLALGHGVIVVTGHLGNWELGGAWLAATGIPMEAVVQVQRNRRFDEDLRRVRERVGLTTIPKQQAPRGVLRALGAGHAVALVADQIVSRGGLFVDFFGRLAATARGPAVFALRSGSPIWVGAAVRVSRRPQRYLLRLRRVEVALTGDNDADVRRVTEDYTRVLESWVRDAPEQYFWHHKRWKTRPDPRERRTSPDDITS